MTRERKSVSVLGQILSPQNWIAFLVRVKVKSCETKNSSESRLIPWMRRLFDRAMTTGFDTFARFQIIYAKSDCRSSSSIGAISKLSPHDKDVVILYESPAEEGACLPSCVGENSIRFFVPKCWQAISSLEVKGHLLIFASPLLKGHKYRNQRFFHF